MSNAPFTWIECTILAAIIACITLAAGAIDMRDSMAKCQERHSFSTCHAALNR
jgi:hypothetical protein